MSRNIGNSSYSLLNNKETRQHIFNTTHDLEIYKIINDNIKVNFLNRNNKIEYYTNDFKNKETLHFCYIEYIEINEYSFIFQSIVNRLKNDLLQRNYSVEFLYDIFLKQKLPIITSKTQYKSGNVLWNKLIDIALNHNKFCYYFNEIEFIKITDVNKNELLDLYFGVEQNYEHKHLVVSHKEIKNI